MALSDQKQPNAINQASTDIAMAMQGFDWTGYYIKMLTAWKIDDVACAKPLYDDAPNRVFSFFMCISAYVHMETV